MRIYIIGHRCKICDAVEELVLNVVEENEISATIKRVLSDMDTIKFGISLTPAVIVESEIKVMGRKPQKEEILSWITEKGQSYAVSDNTECSSKKSQTTSILGK